MTDLRTAAQQALDILDSEFTTVDGEFCRWCDGRLNAKHNCKLDQTITALKTVLSTTREHITDGSPCWCNPELNYVDPDTEVKVWVHKEPTMDDQVTHGLSITLGGKRIDPASIYKQVESATCKESLQVEPVAWAGHDYEVRA
jgi:hypothetical protein